MASEMVDPIDGISITIRPPLTEQYPLNISFTVQVGRHKWDDAEIEPGTSERKATALLLQPLWAYTIVARINVLTTMGFPTEKLINFD